MIAPIPGQFVEIQVTDVPGAMLRRPISVCNFHDNTLELLVADAGKASHRLVDAKIGDIFNVLMPLGNGFSLDHKKNSHHVLIGGGVGLAPLFYYGRHIVENGGEVTFVLGARTASLLPRLMVERFSVLGKVFVTTNDGTMGTKGMVTQSEALNDSNFQNHIWSVCGPLPMMKAVANIARSKNIPCYVSLENMMACGLGACLCCVQDTVDGNLCVCTHGPVFNTRTLKW